MPRKILTNHWTDVSLATAIMLISGVAWAQSDAAGSSAVAPATTSELSATTTPSGVSGDASSTMFFDSTLPWSQSQSSPSNGRTRATTRSRSVLFDDSADVVARNDNVLRLTPSASPGFSDFFASVRAKSQPPSLTANSNIVSAPTGSSSHVQAAGGGNGKGNGDGPGDGDANGNEKALGLSASLADVTQGSGHGNGKALGHGLDSSDTAAQGKGHGNGKEKDKGPELASRPVRAALVNPVISDAIASQAGTLRGPALVSGLSASSLTPASVNSLSSSTLDAAPAPVPEPSTWLMLALGLLALGARAVTRSR